MNNRNYVGEFLVRFEDKNPVFAKSVSRFLTGASANQLALAETMLSWADEFIGSDCLDILIDGYCYFVTDVNKSQRKYEIERRYENKTYAEVYEATYNNSEFMERYHWGVYVTTFAWEHHNNLTQFYLDRFIKNIPVGNLPLVADFGCGSGVWHFLASHYVNANFLGLDISEHSLDKTRQMSDVYNCEFTYQVADATSFSQKTSVITLFLVL